MKDDLTVGEADPLPWLLEADTPGVRFLALRELEGLDGDDAALVTARDAAYGQGPIAAILDAMNPAGFWAEPGPGYLPKYRSTVWSLILLAQLGAEARCDGRIARACAYMLDVGLTSLGQFTASGAPSGTADCLQGNLCEALLALGYEDPRLDLAFEWMARTVTGEGLAPTSERAAKLRYYAGKCGPSFACGSNAGLPCAWGAAKVMLAFGRLPQSRRTPVIERAIRHGVDFLFSCDPATARYPTGYSAAPSGNWWKFGFPVFYVTDLLQIVEALGRLGYRDDPRLTHAIALVEEKRDADGRWKLEYDYAGKTWVEFGARRQPNKWVTLRALRALKSAVTKPFAA